MDKKSVRKSTMKTKNRRDAFLAFIASLLFYVVMRFMIYGSVYESFAMMLGLDIMESLPLVEGTMLFIAAVFYANFYQIIRGKISTCFLKTETVLYFVTLFAVVMLKSRGVQDVNFDLTDLYQQLIEYPASVAINFLIFAPTGVLAFKYFKSTPKALFFATVCIVGIEALQYLFSLGIADVVDVVVDLLGFAFGYLIVSMLFDLGFRIIPISKGYIGIIRLEVRNSVKNKQVLTRFLAYGVLSLVVTIVFVLGFVNYDYKEYLPFETSAESSSDATLNGLPKSSYDIKQIEATINSMKLCKLNGTESSTNWITIEKNGQLASSGAITDFQTWKTEDGMMCFGLAFAVPENVNGVTVVHGLPLIVTPETKISVSAETQDFGTFEKRILPEYFFYSVKAKYKLQDGWLQAESLQFDPRTDEHDYFVWFDYDHFTSAAKAINSEGKYWLDIPSESPVALSGFVDILHQDETLGDYFTLRIPDKIGNIMICHSVDVSFKEGVPDAFDEKVLSNQSRIDFSASLSNGEIIYTY